MNLNIKTNRTVTSDDLLVYVEPPLIFEVPNRIDRDTNNKLLEWSTRNFDPALALDIAPRIFHSVSQNGERHPITNKRDAEELSDAIGPDLLSELIEGFWDYNYRFFQRRRVAYEESLQAVTNGHKIDK